MKSSHSLFLLLGTLLVGVLGILVVNPDLSLMLRTQTNPTILPETVTREFVWTPGGDSTPGSRTLTVVATDEHGATTTQDITVVVEPAAEVTPVPTPVVSPVPGETVLPTTVPESGGGGGGESGGGGGGGDSGGGGGGEEERSPGQTHTFRVGTGHRIVGAYSGLVSQGIRRVAKLASKDSVLSRSVRVPATDYWVDVKVRHDRPGPVRMAIYVNNWSWKVVEFNKADNQYYTHRVGQLRNFREGTIAFRLINDAFDRNDPTNEEKDRNLFVEAWRLTTEANSTGLSSTAAVGGGTPASSARRSGAHLLPELNGYLRRELGVQHVRVEIWEYYAWRLTLPGSHRAAITTPEQLVSVMRFWKGVHPERPRGERG